MFNIVYLFFTLFIFSSNSYAMIEQLSKFSKIKKSKTNEERNFLSEGIQKMLEEAMAGDHESRIALNRLLLKFLHIETESETENETD